MCCPDLTATAKNKSSGALCPETSTLRDSVRRSAQMAPARITKFARSPSSPGVTPIWVRTYSGCPDRRFQGWPHPRGGPFVVESWSCKQVESQGPWEMGGKGLPMRAPRIWGPGASPQNPAVPATQARAEEPALPVPSHHVPRRLPQRPRGWSSPAGLLLCGSSWHRRLPPLGPGITRQILPSAFCPMDGSLNT